MAENETKPKIKIEELMKILRQINKKSYNIDIMHLDNKNFKMYLEGEFMQTTKKMTLEDLAIIVSGLATTVTNLSSTVELGFKNVNERLDNIERDVAAIKNCPTIKKELHLSNHNN